MKGRATKKGNTKIFEKMRNDDTVQYISKIQKQKAFLCGGRTCTIAYKILLSVGKNHQSSWNSHRIMQADRSQVL
jgi:hypothetical protein